MTAAAPPPDVPLSPPHTGVGDPVSAGAPAGRGFLAAFVFAYFGLWVALLGPVILTLQLRVQVIAPDSRAATLSLVLGVGAILGLLVNPIAGRLSDRTTSRFGMRRPWLVAGAVLTLLGLVLVALAPGSAVLVLGWAVAQIGINTTLAVLLALLPDHVPSERRGLVSGLLGVGQALAAVVASGVGGALSGVSLTAAVVVPGVIGLVGALVVVSVVRDRRLARAERPPLTGREIAAAYWTNPRRHPDFGWAWLSRFAIFMAIASVLNYQVFYLTDQLRVPAAEVPGTIGLGVLTQTVVVVIGSSLAGWLSDRLGRRRVFVVASAVIGGAGLLVLAFATTLPVYFVAMALVGLGQGVYFAVDLALVADVLPDAETDAAKDLGVINVANLLPQSLAPALAPVLLGVSFGSVTGVSDGNYTALFVVGAIFAVLAAVTILPVRGVR